MKSVDARISNKARVRFPVFELTETCVKMTDAREKDLNQELFSELTEHLVQPLFVHMVSPFGNGNDPKFWLQINENILFEWRNLSGETFFQASCCIAAELHVVFLQ